MKLSQNQIKIIALIAGIVLILAALLVLGARSERGKRPTLVFWSLYDDPKIFRDLLGRYAEETGIVVKYVLKNPETYEEELINALAAGQGPDILILRNSWLPKHFSKLSAAPLEIMTPKTMEEIYPEVVTRDLVAGKQVYAIPLSIDTLALFYNQDILDQSGVVIPPRTWEELATQIPRLAKVSKTGIVERAAISLGTTNNVPYAPDILSLLMIQLGATMYDSKTQGVGFHKAPVGDTSPGVDAIRFYTRFSHSRDPLYTWNRDLPNALEEFSKGNVAMFIGYARDIAKIKTKAPNLDLEVSTMPQPADAIQRQDYANYLATAVSRTSRHPKEAWQFLSWLAEVDQSRLYMRKANMPPARRELIREVLDEKVLGVFARQALTSQTWYQQDPEAVSIIFSRAIDAVNFGSAKPEEAIKQAADQVNLLYRKPR